MAGSTRKKKRGPAKQKHHGNPQRSHQSQDPRHVAPATLGDWIGAARLRTLPLAVAPVILGTGAAQITDTPFHWVIALCCLIVAVALQIGVNFANDYSDGIRGTDAHRVGPARLTGSGLVNPKKVLATALTFFALAAVAGLVAEEMGMFEDEVRMIELAAPLHDIGKIAIPDSLLMKPGPLDENERKRMQQHPSIGYQLLEDSHNRFIQIGARIALHHHERYDGSGYPHGLAGKDIPLEARIVTVADVFDALISPRPYKRAWGVDEALDYIRDQSGKMLDPDCVQALVGNLPRLYEICERYSTSVVHVARD